QVPHITRLAARLNETFAVALPVAFLLGASLCVALVACRAALTEAAPAGQQARVFAVKLTFTEVMIALPLLLAGVGTEFAGARLTLAAVGGIALCGLLLLESPHWRRRLLPRAVPASAAALS
ncbi:MAG: hypothetical protein ACR2HN_13540, partial [Tepidiformaceae bacterium]